MDFQRLLFWAVVLLIVGILTVPIVTANLVGTGFGNIGTFVSQLGK